MNPPTTLRSGYILTSDFVRPALPETSSSLGLTPGVLRSVVIKSKIMGLGQWWKRVVERKQLIIVFGGFAGLYLLTIKGFTGNFLPQEYGKRIPENNPPFETSMERGRFAQTAALYEMRSFAVDEFYSFLKPDLAWHAGHYLPSFPPGVSVLALPFYAVGRAVGANLVFTTALSALAGLGTMWMMYKIGKQMQMSTAAIVFMCAAFGLGTSAWAYGVSISAHLVSAMAATYGLYLCLKRQGFTKVTSFCLGLILAAAVVVDFPNAVILLPLAIFAVYKVFLTRNVTAAILGVVGLMVVLVPYSFFSQKYYGQYFAFTNTYNLKRLAAFPINYDQPEKNVWLDQNYGRNFSLNQLPFGMQVMLFSRDRGLINFSPVYLLAVPGLYWIFKRERITGWLIVGTLAADLLIYSAYDDPWGGWAFGPRYLIPALPGLALGVGKAFDQMKNKVFLKAVMFVMLSVSVGINLLGALTTNAVPPSVEAGALGSESNYMYNYDQLKGGMTSAFVYKTVASNLVSPEVYFYSLWGITMLFIGYFVWSGRRGVIR